MVLDLRLGSNAPRLRAASHSSFLGTSSHPRFPKPEIRGSRPSEAGLALRSRRLLANPLGGAREAISVQSLARRSACAVRAAVASP